VQAYLVLEIDLEPMIDVDRKETLESALFDVRNLPRQKCFFLTDTGNVHFERAVQTFALIFFSVRKQD
jgi:hypothetical protein